MERKDKQTPQGTAEIVAVSYISWITEFYGRFLDFAGETARVLLEFLEVAITAIVYLKGVYPSGNELDST